MCGIFGFVINEQNRNEEILFRLATGLAVSTQSRGVHATGYVGLDRNGNTITAKAPGPAREFVQSDDWMKLSVEGFPSFFIGHCRAATAGDPKINKNNHPFFSRDGNLGFVHNGMVRNFKNVASRKNVQMRSDCDSEVILRLIEKESDTEKGIVNAYLDLFDLTSSSGACAMTDSRMPGIYMFRSMMKPLHVARMEEFNGMIVFASTLRIIQDGIDAADGQFKIKKSFECKSDRIYKIMFGEDGRSAAISTKDIPIRSFKTNDFFSRSLPAPGKAADSRFKITGETQQTEMFSAGYDEYPISGCTEVECPCGNIEYLWPEERKDCQSCGMYILHPSEPARRTEESIGEWIDVRCSRCGAVWEQHPSSLNRSCVKCNSIQTALVETDTELNKAHLWRCPKCKVEYIAVSKPKECTKCNEVSTLVWVREIDGVALPMNWDRKQCHDCRTSLSYDGPSRCEKCADKRKEKDSDQK